MTWFKDFENCKYFGEALENKMLAVGWLSRDNMFSKGLIDESELRLVIEFCEKPLWIHVFRGFHECELCEPNNLSGKTCSSSGGKTFGRQRSGRKYSEEDGVFKSTSHLNIFVPYGDKIIVAPENLPHYIKEHGYKPPSKFFDALRSSPKPGTNKLVELLVKIGGNSFQINAEKGTDLFNP